MEQHSPLGTGLPWTELEAIITKLFVFYDKIKEKKWNEMKQNKIKYKGGWEKEKRTVRKADMQTPNISFLLLFLFPGLRKKALIA